ncbi:MAG: hypothetical protein AAF614_31765 [Chloroflexota bacterium]
MAKKQQSLEKKLGSWTDQAKLTRTPTEQPVAQKTTYRVNRSLMDRVADLAQAQGMSENEIIGRLLTWALDEVANGNHEI